jgi:hypothetical protein
MTFPLTSFPESHPKEAEETDQNRLENDRQKATATILNVHGGISIWLLVLLLVETGGLLVLVTFVPVSPAATYAAFALLAFLIVTFVTVPYGVREEVRNILIGFVFGILLIRIAHRDIAIRNCHTASTFIFNPSGNKTFETSHLSNMESYSNIQQLKQCDEYTFGIGSSKSSNMSAFQNYINSTLPQAESYDKKKLVWGRFNQMIAEGQYLLASILETAEITSENVLEVLDATKRWTELMELTGSRKSQSEEKESEDA